MVEGWQPLQLRNAGVRGAMDFAIPETKLGMVISLPFNFLHPQVLDVGVDNRLL